jgi:hypothetical protein
MSRGTRQRPTRRLSRAIRLAVLGLVVVASLSLSGCAAGAWRAVGYLDTAYTLFSIFGPSDSDEPAAAPPLESTTQTAPSYDSGVPAQVFGTDGEGLWLLGQPGADQDRVVPEGTVVTLYCYVEGESIDGPTGTTGIWDYAVTPDGAEGFMSDAYLDTGTFDPVVPECSTTG